ncbi:MAG: nuclear transport factor 2 family protein [Desulfobacterales bacterium]|nr:MAG: nuclear transport factor 2 family protein [Desulfobacterales bacterium]
MKKSLLSAIILLSLSLLIIGCAAQTKLADYQPKSAEEKQVLETMVRFQESQKERDLAEYMACFHNNATIKYNQDGIEKPILSKQQFEDRLKAGYWGDMETDMVNPKITIVGNDATVRCYHYVEGYGISHSINLIKESEKWSIIKWGWKEN